MSAFLLVEYMLVVTMEGLRMHIMGLNNFFFFKILYFKNVHADNVFIFF